MYNYNPKLHFHFTGIGGSGMSGIAEILISHGFNVSGSDLKLTEICRRLERLGAQVFQGHAAEFVPASASLLVYSSAVSPENPELLEAKRRRIPVVRRAEVLAELMRLKYGVAVAGSHGKTTTTSMIAEVMERAGVDPSVIIGGQLCRKESGSRLGRGEFLVAETDESDRSFLLLKPTIAVVTNIDTEHLNAYSSMQDLENSFEQFIRSVPFYGLVVVCEDDERLRKICSRYEGRKITYGFSPSADIRAVDLLQEKGKATFSVEYKEQPLFRLTLPLPGKHLVLNSLAAIALGLELQVPPEVICQALSNFPGVKRRSEVVADINGVTIINDYAHHPTEIRATLRAVREGWGQGLHKMHVVFQPHRYSRTQDCFEDFIECFQDCDELIISEVYAAGEEPLQGVSGEKLNQAIAHPSKTFLPQLEDIAAHLAPRLKSGDIVVCIGAGSVGAFPELLEDAIGKL